MNIDQEVAKKVLQIVDAGLVQGMGVPIPGKMCVEAAVCFAMGLEHSDNPPCVGYQVRKFKIELNDSNWSSNDARAKGMRKLAIAQLGSDQLDQHEFVINLLKQVNKILIPRLFRKMASFLPQDQYKFLKAADRCEQEATAEAASLAYDVTNYVACGGNILDAVVAVSVDVAASVDVDAARASFAARAAVDDEFLNMSADIALNILIQMKSPGCEFLYLCD